MRAPLGRKTRDSDTSNSAFDGTSERVNKFPRSGINRVGNPVANWLPSGKAARTETSPPLLSLRHRGGRVASRHG